MTTDGLSVRLRQSSWEVAGCASDGYWRTLKVEGRTQGRRRDNSNDVRTYVCTLLNARHLLSGPLLLVVPIPLALAAFLWDRLVRGVNNFLPMYSIET